MKIAERRKTPSFRERELFQPLQNGADCDRQHPRSAQWREAAVLRKPRGKNQWPIRGIMRATLFRTLPQLPERLSTEYQNAETKPFVAGQKPKEFRRIPVAFLQQFDQTKPNNPDKQRVLQNPLSQN